MLPVHVGGDVGRAGRKMGTREGERRKSVKSTRVTARDSVQQSML